MQLISEIMTYGIASVAPNESVQQALQKMDEWNIHAVPVCDGTHLVGILSLQDITGSGMPEATLPNRPVADFMTSSVVCCFEDQSVDDVLHEMSSHRIRHVPVLNRDEELIGIVSLTDVVNRIAGLPRERAQELLRTFGPEQLASKEIRSHRLASSSADGKF